MPHSNKVKADTLKTKTYTEAVLTEGEAEVSAVVMNETDVPVLLALVCGSDELFEDEKVMGNGMELAPGGACRLGGLVEACCKAMRVRVTPSGKVPSKGDVSVTLYGGKVPPRKRPAPPAQAPPKPEPEPSKEPAKPTPPADTKKTPPTKSTGSGK